MSKIVAETLMVVIVIVLSSMVFFWVTPAFQQNLGQDNHQQAYLESFKTVQGDYVLSSRVEEEVVRTSPGPWTPNRQCTSTSPVNLPYTGNVLVPVNGVCVISATVTGNVYASSGSTLTVNNTVITGTLNGNFSAQISILNSHIFHDVGSYSVQTITISGSQIDGNLYVGNRAFATMTGSTVVGDAEFEVNSVSIVTGNIVRGALEAEDDNFAQVSNNVVGGTIDTDGDGSIAISGNTVTGNILFGRNGWCAAATNSVVGSTSGSCTGQVRIDIINTGAIPVVIQAIYVGSSPSTTSPTGTVSWTLGSGVLLQCGNQVLAVPCNQLPIVIPVGKTAQIFPSWSPTTSGFDMRWLDVRVIFVSTHGNFVDGDLYFGAGLQATGRSRPVPGICPPCR